MPRRRTASATESSLWFQRWERAKDTISSDRWYFGGYYSGLIAAARSCSKTLSDEEKGHWYLGYDDAQGDLQFRDESVKL